MTRKSEISGLHARQAQPMLIARRSALGFAAAAGAGIVPPLTAAMSPAKAEADGFAQGDGELQHLVVRHRSVMAAGQSIFYREVGRLGAPAILLLHGFPTSSHMFRHLLPALADRYRVVAPDYPGFGRSAPLARASDHSFASLAKIVEAFTDVVGLTRYAIYIQDYGAPVGLRLALSRPERVSAMIVQNGNAYEEGLSDGWDQLKAYWAEPTPERREKLLGWLDEDGIRLQYVAGVPKADVDRFAPENWLLDWAVLNQPGRINYQLDHRRFSARGGRPRLSSGAGMTRSSR
jgi:pimeloyl-ACP methyl ester carboxylesterase